MPVVCGVCGSSNRSSAKFCSGCANRLPGFTPSGPSALDAQMALRPPSHVPARGSQARTKGSSVPLLPAETAGFWLRVGCLIVAMGVAFTLWFLYVTEKLNVPQLPSEVAAALTLETRPAEPSAAPALPAETAPAAAAASAPPISPAAPTQQAAQAAATPKAAPALPADTVAKSAPPASPAPPAQASEPAPAKASAPEASAKAEPPSVVRRPTQTAGARSTARSPEYSSPSYPRTGPMREPLDAASQRALSLARGAQPDLGPPIAPGPGPLYDRAPASPRTYNDPGPPVAAGPGPLYPMYGSPRPPVRAPGMPSGDPGPPIAIGPGPLVDYSTRGAGSR